MHEPTWSAKGCGGTLLWPSEQWHCIHPAGIRESRCCYCGQYVKPTHLHGKPMQPVSKVGRYSDKVLTVLVTAVVILLLLGLFVGMAGVLREQGNRSRAFEQDGFAR